MSPALLDFLTGPWAQVAAVSVFALAALIISWKIMNDGILYAAEDIWWHIIWLKEFVSELNEGVWYPRWLAQSNFLYGSPTFVFYPPLCYYLGALLQKVFDLTTMQATTALSLFANFLCGCSLFYCTRKRFGEVFAAAGALVFMTAPFVVFDIYFRECIPELWSMVWLPFIMFAVDRPQSKKWQICLAVAFCLLALTHVPSLFIYSIVWSTRLLFCAATSDKVKLTLKSGIGFAALGLTWAAFFLLPVVLERGLVDITAVMNLEKLQASLVGAGTYCAHPIMPEIVLTSTGQAAMMFCLIAFIAAASKLSRKELFEPTYWFALNLVTTFLMTAPSKQIWLLCRPLQFLQFPTRFMTVNCFSSSVLFAIALQMLVRSSIKKFLKVLIGLLLFCLFARQVGIDHIITKYRSGIDIATPYIVESGAMQGRDEYARFMMPRIVTGTDGFPGSPEYRPMIKSDDGPPKAPPSPHHGKPAVTVVEGAATLKIARWESYHRLIESNSDKGAVISIRCFAYPAWRLTVDGQPVPLKQAADGSMLVSLAAGKHQVALNYGETTAFQAGKAISVLSLLGFPALLFLGARRRKNVSPTKTK